MPTTTERLLKTAQTLPESLLAEVLDFAEFLRVRHGRAEDAVAEHSLLQMCGGLKDSVVFAKDPIEIQRRLRDEWH